METTPIICRHNGGLRPPARCRRGQAQSFKGGTRRNGNYGFLNTTFNSIYSCNGNRERLEREFKNSLNHLCNYYGLAVPDMAQNPYPKNIYNGWSYLQSQLAEKEQGIRLMVLKDKGKRAVLSVVHTFDLNGLYFVPVRAYWRWCKTAGQEKIAELVTVIFAYLHQVAGVPFYAENGSFMDCQYETLEHWMQDVQEENGDEEDKAWQEIRENTLYELRQAGCHILRRIQNPDALARMEAVITGYRHADQWELEWELLGMEFLQLYKQFPKHSIHDNIHTELIYPDEQERISAYEYTGFYWSGKDCFASDLDEMINNNFQEISVVEEPNYIMQFDRIPLVKEELFGFEKKVYELMERLRDLLNDYDSEDKL